MQKVNLISKVSRDGTKRNWHFEYGRGKGQRFTSGFFTYEKPKTSLERTHNRQVEGMLKTEQAKRILELSEGRSPFASRLLDKNLLSFYEEYVETHKKDGNRHLQGSLVQFTKFLGVKFPDLRNKDGVVAEVDATVITEGVCKDFRDCLCKRFNGETPMNYFSRFKEAMRNATKVGYFHTNPCEDISPKKGKDTKQKDILDMDEFDTLMKTPCSNPAIKQAFLFCMLTGIRGQSVRALRWKDIKADKEHMSIVQGKTGNRVDVPILPDARKFLPKEKGNDEDLVFALPTTQNGCNKMLTAWVKSAGIDKHITWHCARHSVGNLLKSEGVSIAQIADILGQKTTKYAERVYTRMTDLESKRALLARIRPSSSE